MQLLRLCVLFAFLILFVTATSMTAVGASLMDDYPDLEYLEALINEEEISPMHLLAYRAVNVAMERLGFQRGNIDVLVITNAGASIIMDEYPTSDCLDALALISGCCESRGNLISVNSPKWKAVWFAFYRKGSGDCVYIEANSNVLASYMEEWRAATNKGAVLEAFMNLADEELFERVAVENVGAENLLNNPEAWHERMESKVFGGNEFSIMTIAACWDKGLPYELYRAAELHNHICPGLISGTIIIEYLDKYLPIQENDQYYIILAVPPWCKDDAFQAVYDSTVGKRRMTVMMLSREQSQQLPSNVAGIYVRWDRGDGRGDAVVLTFDWDRACEQSGIERSWFKDFNTYKWWYARLKMDLDLLDKLGEPEELVSTVEEFTIESSSELTNLRIAGVNPYVNIGLMPAPEQETIEVQVEVVPTWIYAVIAILILVTILITTACIVKLRKTR